MKVSVIIPTYNAEIWLKRQLEVLLNQTVKPEIIVIDSGSTDQTVPIAAACSGQVRLLQIPYTSFDHGGTRDLGLRQSTGDIVLFLTQDALPASERYIEKLIYPFEDQSVAAVFGRQIARKDAPLYEQLTREFNYPNRFRSWEKKDIPRYGVKAYFFSNVCSAYRRDAYLAVGGFDNPILSNEDMMMAEKLLCAGFKLAYTPEAEVYHSHCYSLREEFLRNVRIGTVMEQYKDWLIGADADAEGWKMVKAVGGELIRRGCVEQLLAFYTHAAFRLAGNRVGRIRGRRNRTDETDSIALHI